MCAILGATVKLSSSAIGLLISFSNARISSNVVEELSAITLDGHVSVYQTYMYPTKSSPQTKPEPYTIVHPQLPYFPGF